LRELAWQAGESLEQQWNHTAALLAQSANTVRDPRRKPAPYAPDDFHPVLIARRRRERRRQSVPRLPITVLKTIFIDNQREP